VLHGFGLLATDHLEETTGLDLAGQYVGQTKEKVKAAMEAARGGVLFIDEAYAMVSGPYGSEAVTKLLSMLTGTARTWLILDSESVVAVAVAVAA
jgi:hypothetical protein